jgi:anti-sigma regulatory factor (Ser/Thr protein kinase)
MADEHLLVERPTGEVWDLVSTYGPDVAGLCRASDRLMPGIAGVGLSAGNAPSGPLVRFTSDDVSSLIEDVQVTAGEGPCRDATATRRPVVAPDLSAPPWRQRWPQFTAAALDAGVRAVYALPLQAGGVRHHGALDLYRTTPGGLDTGERRAASTFAAAAAELLTLEELRLDAAAVQLVCWFDRTRLATLREQVRALSARQGLAGDDLHLFVLAVYEALTNVARHGGGHGQLLLWEHADHLWCEIADHGTGIPGTYLPIRQPDVRTPDGRGLWLMRRTCNSCKVTTDSTGTRLLLGYRLRRRLRDHGRAA